jgi:hypothetical protein
MGAQDFTNRSKGKDARSAFIAAQEEARYNYGHRGYTGSIAEKDSFTLIPLPEGTDPQNYAFELIDKCDKRIDDKWGPAGCFDLGNGEYFFFGWASS